MDRFIQSENQLQQPQKQPNSTRLPESSRRLEIRANSEVNVNLLTVN